MKKVKLLQVAVYIVFAALFVQEALPDAYKGFQEGYKDGVSTKKSESQTELVPSVLISPDLIKTKDAKMTLSSNYQLENVSINADIRVKAGLMNTPWWIIILNLILVLIILFFLVKLSLTLNKIIFSIYSGDIFQRKSVNQISQVGFLLIVYSVADYILQQVAFLKSGYLINSPVTVLNASSFNFELTLVGLLVLIVAEAFKQGVDLKEQQELTI